MSVSLVKGGNVSLSKEAPGLKGVVVGLGWDVRTTDGGAFDLDASVLMLDASGRVFDDKNFVFYNNLESPDGSVKHSGDNITGEGDGDDEKIFIDLSGVAADVTKISVLVTIHMAAERRQNFGQVSSAFMRIVNQAGEVEIARFDLSEDASTATSMMFGDVYRHNGEWKFKAIGQGYNESLAQVVGQFGVNLG